MSKRLEAIEQMARGEVPQAPVARLIGFELTSIRHGESVIELEAGDVHANPMGTLHGGILCDIADAAMGIAFASTLDEGESFTTLELKINFLRPVWKDKLRAAGKVVKRGKMLGPARRAGQRSLKLTVRIRIASPISNILPHCKGSF